MPVRNMDAAALALMKALSQGSGVTREESAKLNTYGSISNSGSLCAQASMEVRLMKSVQMNVLIMLIIDWMLALAAMSTAHGYFMY